MIMLLKQQTYNSSAEETSMQILTHSQIPDVLLLPVNGPRYKRNVGPGCVWKCFKLSIKITDTVFLSLRHVEQVSSEVVVGAQCGNSVLRGAHVFAPGIVASPKCENKTVRFVVFLNLGHLM